MSIDKTRPPIGSIWTVRGVEGGHALVILGPIMRDRGGPQFIVVPIYTGQEPGFGWTDQDVRLESRETSYADTRFLGVWNARPLYERDLERFVMRVPDAHIAIAIAQDVYWASAQGRRLKHPRLGSPMRYDSPTTEFQERERQRWSGPQETTAQPSEARIPGSGRTTAGRHLDIF